MSIKIGDLFKHEKLKIESHTTSDRNDAVTDENCFTVMFNPESFSRSYANSYKKWHPPVKGQTQQGFTAKRPNKLSLTLILDNTGVTEWGFLNIISAFGDDPNDIIDRVNFFLTLTTLVDKTIHQPRWLKIKWGKALVFECVLQSVDIKYTLFNESGNPIRAELDTVFVSDDFKLEAPTSSPDMTHTRTVKAGDNLLLLTKEIYGNQNYYLKVAQANNLVDFRNLEPGTELVFPPLEK